MWSWTERAVSRAQPHLVLTHDEYGSPVALVGPADDDGVFPVEFLVSRGDDDPLLARVVRDAVSEIGFYLVEAGRPDPWAYAIYHCGTASNRYSRVHWSYVEPSGTLTSQTVPRVDFATLLRDKLDGIQGQFELDELAFLALTSKVELPIRDRLAYALFRDQELSGCFVAREWNRVDLAVLSRDAKPMPRMLLEAKALYTFDLVGAPDWIGRYPEKVRRDLQKLRGLNRSDRSAELFALVLATHPTVAIGSELRDLAKYWSGITKAVRDLHDQAAVVSEAASNLGPRLRELGPVVAEGKIQAGAVYGVAVDILYWLVDGTER